MLLRQMTAGKWSVVLWAKFLQQLISLGQFDLLRSTEKCICSVERHKYHENDTKFWSLKKLRTGRRTYVSWSHFNLKTWLKDKVMFVPCRMEFVNSTENKNHYVCWCPVFPTGEIRAISSLFLCPILYCKFFTIKVIAQIKDREKFRMNVSVFLTICSQNFR